jgi:glycosyltransferase 2 family protein
MKWHSAEPRPGSRASDVGKADGRRSTRSERTKQRADLSAASSLILPELGSGPGRGVITRWAFGLLVLAGLVLAVLHFSDLAELAALARSARPEWLLLALVSQAGTYLCAGSVLREALKQAGRKLPLKSLATLGLVKLFADQAVPSVGLSGTILLLRGLARRDIPASMTMSALLVDVVSYYCAYLAVVLVGVGLLWINHRANAAVLAGATIFAAVAIAIPVVLLWLRHLGRVSLPNWTKRFPKAVSLLRAVVAAPSDALLSPSLMTKVTLLQLSVFLLDSLTLWLSFQALGAAPAFWKCFAAFVVASAAATIGPIPLGLGTFEAACVAILHLLGVPLSSGLAATLLLRFLTFWLPMVPGVLLTRHEFGID